MKLIRNFFSHSFFVSLCAVALCYQTMALLGLEIEYSIFLLVFFSTLSGYNFYWLICKWHFADAKTLRTFLLSERPTLLIIVLSMLFICYGIFLVPAAFFWVILASSLTLLYSLPLWTIKKPAFIKKAGFLKTTLLAFTWSMVTVIFPLLPQLIFVSTQVKWLFAIRFLFMLLLCIIFDTRDAKIDKMNSLHSIATDVSPAKIRLLIYSIFILYVGAVFFWALGGGNERQAIVLMLTGLLTFVVYILSIKKRGYYFYYFLVDGMMLLTAIATYVATI